MVDQYVTQTDKGGLMMGRSQNRRKGELLIAAGLLLFAALLKNAQAASAACREALEMCGMLLIPSLFPFFVLSGFLNRVGLPGILGRALAPPRRGSSA